MTRHDLRFYDFYTTYARGLGVSLKQNKKSNIPWVIVI